MLKAQPLTVEAYRPYGDVVAARADRAPVKANAGTAERYNRLGGLENLRPGQATPNLCLFRSSPFEGERFTVRGLERHAFSTQVFIPMTCARRYLVIVALGSAEPDPGTLRAFLASRDQGITYHPGVWHHPLIALDAVADFACLVCEDDSPGDCEVRTLAAPLDVTFSVRREARR